MNQEHPSELLENLKTLAERPQIVGSPEQMEMVRLASLLGVRLRFGASEVVRHLPRIEQDLKTPSTNESTVTPLRSGAGRGGSTTKATKMPATSWLERSQPE
jgi:hypothetical protein